jgi:hypothetical protein
MAEFGLTEVFVECPGCHGANRLVAVGLDDYEAVNCSHCRTRLGIFGKLKLMANSQNGGAFRSEAQRLTLH